MLPFYLGCAHVQSEFSLLPPLGPFVFTIAQSILLPRRKRRLVLLSAAISPRLRSFDWRRPPSSALLRPFFFLFAHPAEHWIIVSFICLFCLALLRTHSTLTSNFGFTFLLIFTPCFDYGALTGISSFLYLIAFYDSHALPHSRKHKQNGKIKFCVQSLSPLAFG